MNYYIDFDRTLYDSVSLTKAMIEKIAELVSKMSNSSKEVVLDDAESSFNSSTDNMLSYTKKIAEKYNVESDIVVQEVKNVIKNGEKFVYKDSINFLKRLQESGNQIILLTFLPQTNQEYQLQKINGSGIAMYFDTIILTTQKKYTLKLNYENGVFIDDNPKELEGFNSNHPQRLVRMRRPDNKRSQIDMNLANLEEYATFDDVPIDFIK